MNEITFEKISLRKLKKTFKRNSFCIYRDLYLYLEMYVYVCICKYMCMCVYLSVCMCMCMSVCMCIYICVYVYICLCVCVCVCACVYVCVCVCVYVNLFTLTICFRESLQVSIHNWCHFHFLIDSDSLCTETNQKRIRKIYIYIDIYI